MKPLTLAEIEQELLDAAYSADWRNSGLADRLRALARRIAVQIEADKLAQEAA